MSYVSKHFRREEFKCKCGTCDRDAVDVDLLRVLERLRDYYSAPIRITSGNRCPFHNEAIGGSKTSQHMLSKAADIQVEGIPPEAVYEKLNGWYPLDYGIILYNDWVHFDVRNYKYREDKR